MRKGNCIRVTIISVLCLVSSLAVPSNDSSSSSLGSRIPRAPAVTNLGAVANDLHILARVTNAIFLQSAALRKSIKLHDVLVELLDVGPESFSKMLKLDVKSIIPVLETIHKKAEKIMMNETPRANYSMITEVIDFVESWFTTHVTTGLSYSLSHLKTALEEKRSTKTTYLVCDDGLLSDASSFLTATKNKAPSPHAAVRVFEDLKGILPNIIECVKRVSTHSAVVDLKKTVNEFVKFDNLTNFLTRYAEHIPHIARMDEEVGKLIDDFKRMESYWVGYVEERTMNEMSKALEVHISMEKEDAPAKMVTAGFESAQEMAQIVDDVRSKRFKEQVAKGKNTEELAKALEPFRKFGEEMERLGTAFEKVMSTSLEYSKATSSFFEVGKGAAASIASFSMQANSRLTIENLRGNTKDCWNKAPKAGFRSVDASVTNAFSLATNVITHLDELEAVLSSFNDTKTISSWTKALEEFRQKLEVDINENNVFAVKEGIEPDLDAKVRLVFEKLKSIKEVQNDVDGNIGELQAGILTLTASNFDRTQEVETSKLKPFLDCLTSTFYNADNSETDQKDILRDLAEFVREVKWLSEKSNSEKHVSFFKNIAELQNDVKQVEKVVEDVWNKKYEDGSPDLVLKFSNKSRLLSKTLGSGIHVLFEIDHLMTRHKGTLLKSLELEPIPLQIVQQSHDRNILSIWANKAEGRKKLEKMFAEMDGLNSFCGKLRGKNLMELKDVFEEVTKVQGIPVTSHSLFDTSKALMMKGQDVEADVFRAMATIPNMDFASKHVALTGAATALAAVEGLYDDFFGNRPVVQTLRSVSKQSSGPSVVIVVVICVGVFILLVVSCVVGYGFTRNGKRKYKNLYLFYFGKPEEYEKRWRYSMFLDRADGVNSLAHATREMNLENVVKAVRKGAYINVYNKYGNTPLHTASRFGNAALATVLIKNGADRSLLNAQNKTPAQMLSVSRPESRKTEKYAETVAVFEKYKNKKFRVRVPDEFPISSFHIYIEDRTDDGVTSEFMLKFRSITSEEALVTTTHCVVKTEEGDVLATDSLNLIALIFHGVIMVKDTWMVECLKDEKEIAHDYKYLVEKVKYKGVVYENVVTPWTQAKAKGTMPFLYGVFAVVVMDYYPNLELVSSLIVTNGGTMLDAFPDKSQFNQGSHPYLHAHLGPLFVLHDGTNQQLLALKTDPMFTLFTEDEFIDFMLKREINIDKSKDPVHAVDDND